ncbi:molybdenum ABC transporter ATP-binding protein ModC [Shewanella dokdonensis]|uniref:Molybdenum ABC transporter ATP-binding protein ModC n=1 Tax=Shewanella dokdonensis TaxID=712036 RepID=A0ABX8DI63_9GAMM|nr:molybdenum ABC transporter ATP-binding protein ModC [Shewanella dokdonensis]MCL1076130.1 molybdenum ABC transporter ATP-binding protein ModC [Shewanella dokdonensis]QVK24479.1 molybdenum ABC transporter ATP-binding protein ModC [Shewanella dokdonensis]
MLSINVKRQLGETLLDVDVALPLQGVSAVFGRSGAGKTSLVNILGGLATPDSGEVKLGDRWLYHSGKHINLPPEKRNAGFVFQDARLFPHYRVRGNLNYGRKGAKSAKQFDSIVQLLGLEHLLERYPTSLSGGEKQRVAIGRALLTSPEILLMDEPLASLDLPRKRELLPYLQRLTRELNLPIVYVSHSLDEILQLADQMLVIDKGKAVICGPLETVWDSAELRPWLSQQEQSSLLLATVAETHPDYAMTRLQLENGASLWVNKTLRDRGERIRVRVHSNQVSVCTEKPVGSSIRNVLPVTVEQINASDDSDYVQLRLQLSGMPLWANITRWSLDELALKPGSAMFAQIKGVSLTEADLAHS